MLFVATITTNSESPAPLIFSIHQIKGDCETQLIHGHAAGSMVSNDGMVINKTDLAASWQRK